jgi:hypothetical protein
MKKEIVSQAEADGEILTFDVSDDTLERLAARIRAPSLGYIALTPSITAIGRSSYGFRNISGNLAILAAQVCRKNQV